MKVKQIENLDTLISEVQDAYQHRLLVVLLVLKFRNIQYAADTRNLSEPYNTGYSNS